MSAVQLITVTEDEGESRLDRWMKKHFPQITQGTIEKMCRKGEIRVDKGRVKASDRVAPGMEIRIPPLPDSPAPEHEPDGKISKTDAQLNALNTVCLRLGKASA